MSEQDRLEEQQSPETEDPVPSSDHDDDNGDQEDPNSEWVENKGNENEENDEDEGDDPTDPSEDKEETEVNTQESPKPPKKKSKRPQKSKPRRGPQPSEDEEIFYRGSGQIPISKWLKILIWWVLGSLIFWGSTYIPTELPWFDNPEIMSTFSIIVKTIAMGFVGLGLALWVKYWIEYHFSHYYISNQRIEIERGFIVKQTELIELFKIQDLAHKSFFNRGMVYIESGDLRTPYIEISIPHSYEVYGKLRDALPKAREQSKVGIRMDMR